MTSKVLRIVMAIMGVAMFFTWPADSMAAYTKNTCIASGGSWRLIGGTYYCAGISTNGVLFELKSNDGPFTATIYTNPQPPYYPPEGPCTECLFVASYTSDPSATSADSDLPPPIPKSGPGSDSHDALLACKNPAGKVPMGVNPIKIPQVVQDFSGTTPTATLVYLDEDDQSQGQVWSATLDQNPALFDENKENLRAYCPNSGWEPTDVVLKTIEVGIYIYKNNTYDGQKTINCTLDPFNVPVGKNGLFGNVNYDCGPSDEEP